MVNHVIRVGFCYDGFARFGTILSDGAGNTLEWTMHRMGSSAMWWRMTASELESRVVARGSFTLTKTPKYITSTHSVQEQFRDIK